MWYIVDMANRLFTDEKEKEVAQEYLNGSSARALAKKYGTGHNVIVAVLRRTNTEQRDVSERNRLYQVDKHAFDIIDNEAKAYWWGFIYADGSVNREKTVSVKLSSKDIEHLDKFKIFLESEHPITIRTNTVNGKNYLSACFTPTEKHLAKRLMSLGVTVGRGQFQRVSNNISEHLIHHWIRGFFDGDGSIHAPERSYRPCFSLCGRKEELEWVRKMLHGEIDTRDNQTIAKHRTANTYYLSYSGGIQCRKLRGYLYKDATIYLQRKYDKFFSIRERKPRQRNEKGQFI